MNIYHCGTVQQKSQEYY